VTEDHETTAGAARTARLPVARAFDDLARWILLVALIVFGAVILWDYGFLAYLFENDVSGVSSLILAVFGAFSLYCLWFLLDLSAELRVVDGAAARMEAGATARVEDGRLLLDGEALPTGRRLSGFLADMARRRGGGADLGAGMLMQAMGADLRAPVRLGAFISDGLYKLGLLGTVIGFILMLVSMRDLGEFDVETMRDALQDMTGGMAVALLTTITGLACGLLLRMQFNILDSQATRILQRLVRVTEVLLPAAMARGGRDV
jgi:hypothetical protein